MRLFFHRTLLRIGFTRHCGHPQPGGLLPRLFILTCPKTGGYFLLHFPGSHLRLPLAVIPPYEARTFLTRLAARAATQSTLPVYCSTFSAAGQAKAPPFTTAEKGKTSANKRTKLSKMQKRALPAKAKRRQPKNPRCPADSSFTRQRRQKRKGRRQKPAALKAALQKA